MQQQHDELQQVFSVPLGTWLHLARLVGEPYQDIEAIVANIEMLVKAESLSLQSLNSRKDKESV